MTRRGSRKWVGLASTVLAALGAAMIGMVTPARGDVFSYASEKRQVKACVLVSNAASSVVSNVVIPENAVPYVFYMMDRRTDLKPAGWDFINPLAPSTVTPEIRLRWQNRDTGATDTTLASPAFAVGAPLTKNIGAYWEVNLDSVSQSDLQQFDIVVLAYHNGSTQFTPNERDKVRKYVDAGGTVWLEDEGGFDIQAGGNHQQGQFFIDSQFTTNIPAGSVPTLASPHHPLVNFPYPIATTQIGGMGQAPSASAHHIAIDPYTNGPLDPRIVVPVIWSGTASNAAPLVSAGDYGAGHVIISSIGIATGISGFAGGPNVANEGSNTGAVSGEGIISIRLIDLEFAYNMVAWTSAVPTAAVNARRAGGTLENIGADLGGKWATVYKAGGTTFASGAVVYKGVVFYVDAFNVLHAYDTSPGQDLDGDNNPDDGLPDFNNGAPYDEIWNVTFSGVAGAGFTNAMRMSTPTAFSVYNPGGTPALQDMLAVTGGNGVTAVFDPFTLNGAGTLAPAPKLLGVIKGGGLGGADLSGSLVNAHNSVPLPGPSPVFSDGLLFCMTFDNSTDPNQVWHVNPINPLTLQNVWGEPKIGVAPTPQTLGTMPAVPVPGLPDLVGPLAAGYITDQVTGAAEKVIYVVTRPPNNVVNNGGGGNFEGFLFSVKNEPLVDISNAGAPGAKFSPGGQRNLMPWFVPQGGAAPLHSLLPVLHRTAANGVVTDMPYSAGGGAGTFQVAYTLAPVVGNTPLHNIIVLPNPPLAAGESLSADYTLDWPAYPIPDGNGGQTPVTFFDVNRLYRRMSLNNPQGNNIPIPAIQFTGGPSLSSDDLLFLQAGDYPVADRLYAIRDQYPYGPRVGGSTPQLNGAPRAVGPEVAWMFYPNAPVTDMNDPGGLVAPGGYRARLENTDPFSASGAVPPLMVGTDYESVGAAAYANGVVYHVGFMHMHIPNAPLAKEFDAAVIMAHQANPAMSFIVRGQGGTVATIPPLAIGQLSGNLTIQQYNPSAQTVPGQPQPSVTLRENTNFIVDRETSTIQIFECRQNPGSPNGEALNLAMPFIVYQPGFGRVGDYQFNPQGYGALDNMLWWMMVPINTPVNGSTPFVPGILDTSPASGPTIAGNTLYYGTLHGHIISVDLTKMPSDGSQVMLFNSDGTTKMRSTDALLNNTTSLPADDPIFNAPIGTTNNLFVTTTFGIGAFDNELTLIADNNRLIQVNFAGKATWVMDNTQTQTVVGGDVNTGVGQVASTKIPLARPNVVRHFNLNDYIIADSGNNRVVQSDQGGYIVWEMHSVHDDLHFLRPGDPFTLNHPTDIQTYTQIGNGPISFTSPVSGVNYTYSGYYYAYHYLIADSGNFRGLEIIDIYDQNGNPITMTASSGPNPVMQRQVIFVTRSVSEQNKTYRYRTIQQFLSPTPTGTALRLAVTVDNVKVGGFDPGNPVGNDPPDAEAGGGSILIMSRNLPPYDGAVIDTITTLYNPLNGARQAINGPTFFQQFTDRKGNPHYLLCDANGCYDLIPAAGVVGAKSGDAVVTWKLTTTDYQFMTGRALRAASIQRLGQADYDQPTDTFFPRYLITNRFSGADNVLSFGNGTPFVNVVNGVVRGEVVEVRSDTYIHGGYQQLAVAYYGTQLNPPGLPAGLYLKLNPFSAITWMVPKETIPLQSVLKPIDRSIGSAVSDSGTSSYLLEQPTYSDRPF